MSAIHVNSLDHVALWIGDRKPLAEFLCEHLGMHVIEEGEDFTLVGVDAKLGKLTLFDADRRPDGGVLDRIYLRVADLDSACARLPDDLEVSRDAIGVGFEGPQGLPLGLVVADGIDYDLDRVALRVPDPGSVAEGLGELGFTTDDGHLQVEDRRVDLVSGDPKAGDPLLNHLALLVDSAEEIRSEVERRNFEIVKTVDAENTLAVFVRGPADITIEYVEHKPGFSLV